MTTPELTFMVAISVLLATLVVLAWVNVWRTAPKDLEPVEENDLPRLFIVAQTREQAWDESRRWNSADWKIHLITHAEQIRGFDIKPRDRVLYTGTFYAMSDLPRLAENVQIARLQW